MTTRNELREMVYGLFNAAWHPRPFCFDNESFVVPVATPWARLSVRNISSRQETLGPPGARRFKRMGMVYAQLFVPQNTGTAMLDDHVAIVVGAFEGKTLREGGVAFRHVVPRETGPDGSWFGVLVEARAEFEETV